MIRYSGGKMPGKSERGQNVGKAANQRIIAESSGMRMARNFLRRGASNGYIKSTDGVRSMAKAKSKAKSAPAAKTGVPVWVWGILALGVVAVAAFALLGGGEQAAPAADALPAEVSVAQAAELRDQGVFVLDVREPDEWAQAHIPGATLIPLGELQSRVNELPKDQPVLVYCRSGNRSATGRDILRAAGFENVTSMAGGINEWKAAGYATVSGE